MANIVVIDGRKGMRTSLRHTLEQAGHTVRDAEDGQAGLDLVHRQVADVVLTDIFLPGKCGLETISKLRAESPAVNVIAVSGHAPGDKALDLIPLARALGARDTLVEPFGQEELLDRVRRVLIKPYRFSLDRYRIQKRIGAGNTSNVYLAADGTLGRRVAVKILRRNLAEQPDAVARFRRRIELAGVLSHPNTVTAYDAGLVCGRFYLVTEHVRGPSLRELLDSRGELPIRLACEIVRQVAEGLQHAHDKGIVHRALGPGSLRVYRPRFGHGRPTVKILDFDRTASIDENETSAAARTEQALRMLDYVAPEQLEDIRVVDGRIDIFALGVILFEALTGRVPSEGFNAADRLLARIRHRTPRLREYRPSVSAALDSLVAGMLARDPADRPRAPSEVAGTLAAILAPAPLSARRSAKLPQRRSRPIAAPSKAA